MGLMLDYIFIWNVLHFPAGVMPVTTVRKDEQDYSDHHNDSWTGLLKKTTKHSEGMPINVQMIAHSFEDEKALAVMQSLEKRIQFKMKPPQL